MAPPRAYFKAQPVAGCRDDDREGELDQANECKEVQGDIESMPMAPPEASIGDDEDDDSFEAKCKELFEPSVDLLQQEKRIHRQQQKMSKKAGQIFEKEAIGYGPIRTANSMVGAIYDDQAEVPYGATKAIFSQKAVSSGANRSSPIGQPPP
jgi:hypothetical protein